jgi:oligopeptide/dipeptide ABC transporter ATP-binding protein
MSENGKEPLIEVQDVKVYFYLDEGTVRAVEGVSFDIARGRTLGVVGESGCGKSVTSQAIMQIVPPPGKIVEGQIFFHRYNDDGSSEKIELTKLDPRGPEIRSIRGNEIAKIFQEPMTSLSPVHTIGNQIMEAIILHQGLDKAAARERAIEMLDHVGLPQPDQRIDYYPHQLSGGMRQRAMIAMALSCTPSLLIADEPTTALDVTTEAQILELMKGLQSEFGMAIMFITHNLGVIAEMADDVVVMYLGKEVELAPVDNTFYDPYHPYTRDLLRSIPRIGRKVYGRLHTITGSVPDPYNIPPGCPYHPRCRDYMEGKCDQPVDIPFYQVGPNHWARCWLYENA